MEIILSDHIPINESYRCIPQNLYEQVKNYIDDSVINEWVKQWNSTYASPIVCVCKKHGRLCLCFDYHELNNKTIPDRQPIPKIQDMLDCLRGATVVLYPWYEYCIPPRIYSPRFKKVCSVFYLLIALQVDLDTLWSDKCSTLFSAVHKWNFRRAKRFKMSYLFGQYFSLR